MCFDPVSLATIGTIASFATSAGSAVIGYQGKVAQSNAQNRAWEQNHVASLAAKRDAEKGTTTRQLQEAGAVKEQLQDSFVDQARRQANAEVSGVASGRTGITVDALVDDIGRAADDSRAILLTNWENTASQLQEQKEGTSGTYSQRVNSVQTGTPPSFLEPVLGVAGAGLKYFANEEKEETVRV